jgi:hypothetical protein
MISQVPATEAFNKCKTSTIKFLIILPLFLHKNSQDCLNIIIMKAVAFVCVKM